MKIVFIKRGNIHSEFFYKLSQICHNLQSLTIEFRSYVSNELIELISSQNNLKNLKLSFHDGNDWADILPVIVKHTKTLTKLQLGWGFGNGNLSLSFLYTRNYFIRDSI